jgi:hypothetical protein
MMKWPDNCPMLKCVIINEYMHFTYRILFVKLQVFTIKKTLLTDLLKINAVGLAHIELLIDLHYLATAA